MLLTTPYVMFESKKTSNSDCILSWHKKSTASCQKKFPTWQKKFQKGLEDFAPIFWKLIAPYVMFESRKTQIYNWILRWHKKSTASRQKKASYSMVPNKIAARLLISKIFSLPTRLIWTYTVIKIQIIFLPTRLLSTIFYFFIHFQGILQPFFITITSIMHFFMHFHPFITF